MLPILILIAAAAAQTFEVASIKPNAANDHRIMIRMQPGGRFVATGVTTKFLIGQAYNVRDFQITGGPGWITDDHWDVNAKAEGGQERVPPEQLRAMLRAMLEERFQLKVHKDTKEMPVYALVPAKSGHKLQATTAAAGEGGPRGMMRMGRGQLNATGISMTQLAQQLSQQLGRTVTDRTGIEGNFDVNLEWTPEPGQGLGGPFGGPPPPGAIPAAGGDGPTIFTALQEQLGLRLETQKGPVEMIVIDHVAKPSEN